MSEALTKEATSRYEAIADKISAAIVSGELRPGEALRGEAELAALYGASNHTVRKALDALETKGLVSPVKGKRRRVLAPPPRETPLEVVCLAGRMGSGEKEETTPVFSRLLEECLVAFQESGVSVRNVIIDNKAPRLPDFIVPERVDVWLVMGPIEETFLDRLPGRKLRFDYNYGAPYDVAIVPDGVAAGIGAVRYLWDKGHRRIAYCRSSATYPFFDAVENGYRAGLRLLGWEKDLPTLTLPYSRFADETTRLVEAYWRENAPRLRDLDAVILGSSDLAERCLPHWKQQGVKVPDDLSVAAIGGKIDAHDRNSTLTVFANDYPTIARFVRARAAQIVKDQNVMPEKIMIDCFKLEERGSAICRSVQ